MSAKPARPGASRQVRIIGGQWKRTPLPVPAIDGLRPTPDRVRETVFNWLDHLRGRDWHDCPCLDLFAGTGALGFEAASRGAAPVTLVESDAAACALLTRTREKLQATQINLLRGDALSVLDRFADACFALIFLDPPYTRRLLPELLPRCHRLLMPGGLVYAESDQPLPDVAAEEWLAGWQVVRADKAGNVCFGLLARAERGPT